MAEQIYSLICQAMKKVGAIGKNSRNEQQKYMFRGIDAVYNALNPVMSELGLFITPEILEHRREERETENVYNGQVKKSILKYSILTIKYTMYAPDGSNVSCVVVGEGMDSGDKASNKAMSVALKYACFQLFMIPTEEMVDPDAETHVVTSPAKTPTAPKQVKQEVAKVETVQKLPDSPVLTYLANERKELMKARGVTQAVNNDLWKKQIVALTAAGLIPNKALADFTQDEATRMVQFMYTKFDPTGVTLKDDGKTA